MRKASEDCDGDAVLQNMIGDFNLKRMAINNEANKDERDDDKLQQLNNELRLLYGQIMQNDHMQAYNAAKQDLDALLNRVSSIISSVPKERSGYGGLRGVELRRKLCFLRRLPLIRRIIKQRGKQPLPAP